MGGKFLFDDDKETPEVLTSTYLYPEEKKMIQFEVRHWCTNTEDGVGVAGGSPAGDQINHDDTGTSQTLVAEFEGPVSEATVTVSNPR